MEAISENFSKIRRRGRPRIAVVETDLCQTTRSRRCLIDQSYAAHALGVIGNGHEPYLTWLADAQAGRYRKTELAALGRIEDDDLLLDVALELCAMKPKTVKAVALIRARRLVLKPATQHGITSCLRVSINRWRAANPSGTSAQVQEALRLLTLVVEGRRKRQ